MISTGINRSIRRHTVLNTDPTWTDVGSNLDFCSEKPAYIRLKLDCGLSFVACAVPDNSWQCVSSTLSGNVFRYVCSLQDSSTGLHPCALRSTTII